MLFSLSNLHLMLSGKTGYLVLFAVLLAIFTLFIYRKTNPIVSRFIHYFLISMRMLSLIAILLVLFESTAQWRHERTIPPLLAVAIDRSASMSVHDAAGDRPSIVHNLLKESFRDIDPALQIKYFTFADQAVAISPAGLDSIRFADDITNIAGSLEDIQGKLQEQNLNAILLITDGNYTKGGNPIRYASELTTPLYVVGIGTPTLQPDLVISDVEANAFAFTNESTPIRVLIRNNGFHQTEARIVLREQQDVIDEISLSLHTSPSDSSITFNYIPKKNGRQKIVAEIIAKQGELSTENNSKTIYIDVLKSRLQILILAGGSSPDISFLRNHLASSGRFNINVVVEKPTGGFIGATPHPAIFDSLDQCDLFILQDFPTRYSLSQLIDNLHASLLTRPRPLVLMAGVHTDWEKLQSLAEFLPFKPNVLNLSEVQVLPVLSPAGKLHTIMQIPMREVGAWSLLPPIFLMHRVRSPWPDTEILAYAKIASKTQSSASETWPLILVRTNGQKSAAIMGYHLWRWHLMMAGIGNEDEVYHYFINNLVRWLQIERSTDFIHLQLDKADYHYGDPVKCTAQIYDARFKPIANAQVSLSMIHAADKQQIEMTTTGEGKYSATVHPNAAGDYELRLEVTEGMKIIGRTQSQFTVGEYNQEMNELTMQSGLLRGLAQVSSGGFAPADSIPFLLQSIHGKAKTAILNRDVELWNRAYMLATIIILLATEWFVRKRKGMV